jgi:hypothetical protein
MRLFARLPGSVCLTCTHSAPPERARLRTKGFSGALGEATARGVNLYEDRAAACRQNRAASNTGTVQNVRKSQTCRQYSMQTWVFQIALFKGFRNIPHIPLPTGHSVDTNEATRAAPRKTHKLGRFANVPERYAPIMTSSSVSGPGPRDHQPPTADRRPPTVNPHQPPNANRQLPTFEVEKVP